MNFKSFFFLKLCPSPDPEAEGAHEVIPGGPVPVPDLDTQPPVLVLRLEVTEKGNLYFPSGCYYWVFFVSAVREHGIIRINKY